MNKTTIEQAEFMLEYFRHKLNSAIDEHAKAKHSLASAKSLYKSQERIVQELRKAQREVCE